MRRAWEQGPWQEKELLNEVPFMLSPTAINSQADAQQLAQRVREHPTGAPLCVRDEP